MEAATGKHDKVLSLDSATQQVRLRLTHGFSRDDAVRYLATDASAEVPAALEGATFVPRLGRAPGIGDDSTHSSRASLAAFVNLHEDAAIFRRFGLLSARMILTRQAELENLERKLQAIDEQI